MARIKNKLTARTVTNLKTTGYFADGGGLYLQVSKSLSKSWLFIYKRNGKKFEIGLGGIDTCSLAEAREKAIEHKKLIANGIDPLTEKRRIDALKREEKAKSMTFKQCADAYISAHKAGWKNQKHVQQWQNTLEQYSFPFFGDLDVKSIDTGLVTKCLDPIWQAKNETARRLRGRIESVLDWATARKLREGENPARWRGHLDKLLAKPSKIQKNEHLSALPYAEINEFIEQLHQQPGIAAKCLEFTILTGARTGESIGAIWSEIDLEAKIWTIPKERMKADREHIVPLSVHALNILHGMASIRANEYVFSGAQKGLSNMAMLILLRRMGWSEITVHGFRSTFRDWAADQTSYPNELLEMCLAHSIKNKTEAAYRRGDLLKKRFRVMDDWARFCYMKPTDCDNVTPIKKVI